MGQGRPQAWSEPGLQAAMLSWAGIAGAAVLLAALVGLRLQADGIALFWPAGGVGAGLLLATQGRDRIGVLIGTVAALAIGNVLEQRSLPTTLVFITGNIAQSVLLAVCADQRDGRMTRLDTLPGVLAFAGATVLATAGVGIVVACGLSIAGHAHGGLLWIWSIWFGSQTVGILCVAPAALVIAQGRAGPALSALDLAQLGAIGAASFVIIGSLVPETSVAMLLILCALGPLLLWVVLRASVERAALGLLMIAAATIWQTVGQTGVFAGVEYLAQLFLGMVAVLMLSLGAGRAHVSALSRLRRAAQGHGPDGFRLLKALALLVPLTLLLAVSWWSWVGTLADARANIQRTTASIADGALRTLEVQETVLQAALAHVRGRSFDEISSDRAVHEFLAELDQRVTSNRAITLVRPDTGRIAVSSRSYPLPAVDVSSRDYFRAHVGSDGPGTFIGELVLTEPSGFLGFTMSRRDPGVGALAVALLGVEGFLGARGSTREERDDITFAIRNDGALLASQPARDLTAGARLPADAVALRMVRGEVRDLSITMGVDGIARLYHVRQVGSYPVQVVHGVSYRAVRAAWLRQLAPFGVLSLLAAGLLYVIVLRTQTSTAALQRAEVETASARARADRAELLAEREARLRQASAHLENALTAAEAGTWTQDLVTGVRRSDARAARVFGLTAAEAAHSTQDQWLARIHPDDRARVETAVSQAMRNGTLYVAEYRVPQADGSVRWVAGRGRVMAAADGGPGAFYGIIVDITTRRLAEEQLRLREAELARAQRIGKIGSYEVDLRGGAFRNRRSPEYLELHGLPPDAAQEPHDAWVARIHPDDRERAETAFREAVKDGGSSEYSNEYRILRQSDGALRWISVLAEIDRDADGRPLRLFGMHIDITDRKLAEQALRDSEAHYRNLFESNPHPMWVLERDSLRFLAVNDAAVTHYGYSRDEFLAMTIDDIRPSEDVVRLQRVIDSRLSTRGRPSIWKHRKKGGEEIDVEITANDLDFLGRRAVLILANDVTLRLKAEAELLSARTRLELAQEAGRVGAWEYAAGESTAVEWPASFYAELGFQYAKTPSLEAMRKRVHPDDLGLLDETRMEEEQAADGARFAIELRLVLPSGDVRWIERRSRVVISGERRRVLGVYIDVTERKRREQQIELLMREVSHRSKNLLAVVQAIARQTATGDAKDFVNTFSQRVSALAAGQDLLVKTEWQGVDLEDLVRAQLAQFDMLESHRLTVDGPSLRLSAAAAQTIGMALHELATNAGRFGALSNGKGSVAVSWEIQKRAGSADCFILTWVEQGGPPVIAPKRSGFGTIVIESMARLGLSADVELDYRPTGLVWRLQCPVASVLESVPTRPGTNAGA